MAQTENLTRYMVNNIRKYENDIQIDKEVALEKAAILAISVAAAIASTGFLLANNTNTMHLISMALTSILMTGASFKSIDDLIEVLAEKKEFEKIKANLKEVYDLSDIDEMVR